MATTTIRSMHGSSGSRLVPSPWLRFAVRRAVRLVGSLWVVTTASFLMIHLIPGDPVRAALGPTAPSSLVEARRHELGLDDPLAAQYLHYFGNVLHGDFGVSLISRLPVSETISQRLPATLQLAILAFVVAIAIAVPLGVGMGVLTRAGRGPRTELVFTTGSTIAGSIPDFVLGVVLVFVFGVSLGWLPVAQRSGPASYVLPVLSLSLGAGAILARIVRVEMLSVLSSDYVRTARAKRLPPARVYLRHALPNAVTASLTLAGLLLSALVAGTVLVENVFAWPGLGSTIVSSILDKDYPVVQAVVLVYGLGVLLANTVVDIALALLDPRSMIRDS